ncbi:MAG: hypothetical protein K0B06_12160 [Brevefilum sp.]|nr:hypothetical protein [Brevefilum sp.]
MINKKSILGVILFFMLCTLCLSACASSELDAEMSRYFKVISSELSAFWDEVSLFFEDFVTSLGGMFSGLSEIGEGLRKQFERIRIF